MALDDSVVVRPRGPTVLDGRDVYELRDTDLFLPFSVSTAIVVPGPIDADRLKNAVAATLDLFPLYAGRVEKRNGKWLVRLSNDGAVFYVVESPSPDPLVPADAPVVLAPFVFARPIDHISLYTGSSNEPLLKVTLTRSPDSSWSAVGLSSAHVVGDGFACLGFLRTLSQLYQGLSPIQDDVPLYDYPSNASASEEEMAQIETPWLDHPVALSGVEDSSGSVIRVDFRLTAEQIAQLRAGVLDTSPASRAAGAVTLSTQDCLVGALTEAVSRVHAKHGEPVITRTMTNFNCRGIGPIPRNAAGNALIQAIADIPADVQHTMQSYAYQVSRAVRLSFLQARDYDAHTRANIAVCGEKFLRAANNVPEPLALDFGPSPGELTINSTRPFDWTAASFGYPGRARFHHTVMNRPRYIKIFTPNPHPEDPAKWTKGSAEVVFYIEPHIRSDFINEFRSVASRLGVVGEVVFVDV